MNYFLLFILLFSGNATFLGIDLFFLLVPVIIMVQNKSIVKPRYLIVVLFTLLWLISLKVQVPYRIYWLWPIKAYIGWSLVKGLNRKFTHMDYRINKLFSVIFIIAAVAFNSDSRLRFIFGPNVLYRVFLFFLIVDVYSWYKIDNIRMTNIIISSARVLLILYGIYLTGSRGAILTLLVILLIQVNWSLRRLLVLSVMLFWLPRFVPDLAGIRMFNMNVVDSSRYLFYSSFFEGEFIKFFGVTYADLAEFWHSGFAYPHNLFLELLLYFGFVGLCLAVLIVNRVLAIRRKPALSDMIFILFLCSSLISGDLTDNYPILYFL